MTANEDYEVGMELRGKYVMIGEGVRGSLAKQLMAQYDLRADCDPATFGIGFKELWELDPAKHEGLVMHTGGWPMDMETWGGSFIYHLDNNQAYVGYVVGLDYKNLIYRRSRNCSASSSIRRAPNVWKAASGSPTALAPSTKAACSPFPN